MHWNIPAKHLKSKPILLSGLASIACYSSFLENISMKNLCHILCNIPILQDKELLLKLKKLVSAEISHNMQPIGIPHHVHQLKLLQHL